VEAGGGARFVDVARRAAARAAEERFDGGAAFRRCGAAAAGRRREGAGVEIDRIERVLDGAVGSAAQAGDPAGEGAGRGVAPGAALLRHEVAFALVEEAREEVAPLGGAGDDQREAERAAGD